MATFETTLFTKQDGQRNNLHYMPDALELSAPVRVFKPDNYTAVGTEAAADVINLGFPRLAGFKILPELCRIKNPTTGGNFTCNLTLQKVSLKADGTIDTVTSLSAATPIANDSVALSPLASAADNIAVAHNEYLRFLIANNTSTSGVSIAASQVLVTELVGYTKDAV